MRQTILKMACGEKVFTFKRISKKEAEKAYNNGLSVLWCPVKCNPLSVFSFKVAISKEYNRTFEERYDSFVWYNCNNNEVGTYPAYYMPVCHVDRFTGEPTETLANSVLAYDYDFLEIS